MPELPEVEAYRQKILPVILGRRILACFTGSPKGQVVAPLPGGSVIGLRRHGKALLLQTDRRLHLELRLGMSGRLVLRSPDGRHDVFGLRFEDVWLTYSDHRGFGRAFVVSEPEEPFIGLGPDALSDQFVPEVLHARRSGRIVKATLLDQSVVAGVGNIYACESLYRSGLHPLRRLDSLSTDEMDRLVFSVKAVLRDSIACGGATLSDYRGTEGEAGDYENRFAVFQRTGRPCPTCVCTAGVARVKHGGRSTFYCPVRQV